MKGDHNTDILSYENHSQERHNEQHMDPTWIVGALEHV
jgi:hypothetical protein